MGLNKKGKLRVLTENELCASEGKFRAVVMIDSECYQLGEESDELETTKVLCQTEGKGQPLQIFNDKGEPKLI